MTTIVEVNPVFAEPKMAQNQPNEVKPVPPPESQQAPLFACSKCHTRHLLADLSKDMMFCKSCQGSSSDRSQKNAMCKYCRSEFAAANKSVSICPKCDHCVKKYGKPTTCDYCNVIAAFVDKKCHRCAYSEKKYGPPMHCEQCKQRSAFDRRDADGRSKHSRILCWLCTCAYKRALAKAKLRKDGSQREEVHKRDSAHRPHSSRSKPEHGSKSKTNGTNGSNGANGSVDPSPTKKLRVDSSVAASASNSTAPVPIPLPGTLVDPSTDSMSASDNVVTIAQLREQVISLNKQLKSKNQEILKKDVKITELNAEISKEQRDCREKIQDMQKRYNERVQELQLKITGLSKKLATNQKESKKKTNGATTDSPQNPF